MVRSLAIRQTFIFLDLFLALAVVLAAGLIVFELFQPPVKAESIDGTTGDTAVASVKLPEIGGLADYQLILAARLFGKAGNTYQPPPPPVQVIPQPEDIEETRLNLALIGVVNAGSGSSFSSATIQNRDQRGTTPEVFFIDDEILDKVYLTEVHKREVIILNKRSDINGKTEKLSMDEDKDNNQGIAGRAAPPPVAMTSSRITVSRNDLIQDMTENYAELMKVQPRIERDSAGRVLGITADGVGDNALAQKLGLKDGDILQTINNEKVDSQEKILELINKYRNANSFRLGVTRKDGGSRVITYTLR